MTVLKSDAIKTLVECGIEDKDGDVHIIIDKCIADLLELKHRDLIEIEIRKVEKV